MAWRRINRRWSLGWAALALAAVLLSPFAAAGHLRATNRQYTGTAQAVINVGIFPTIRKNCTAGPLPTIRLASRPAHGRLTVKQGDVRATNIRQCLAMDLPAFVAVYRAKPDFVGRDNFTLELVGVNDKLELQHVTVVITAPGKRQGI